MGDYGENMPISPDAVQLTFAQKAGASLFPSLTDGILLDENKLAEQRSASALEQTKISLSLRPETSIANLTAFCARHKCTLLGVLNVAWALVLSTYTDTELAQVLFVRYKDGTPYIGLSEIVTDGGETILQVLALVEQHLSTGMPVPSTTTITDLQNWTASDGHPVFNSVVLFSDSTTAERKEVCDPVILKYGRLFGMALISMLVRLEIISLYTQEWRATSFVSIFKPRAIYFPPRRLRTAQPP